MPLNKDGLEAGAPVDFATLQRIKRNHKGAQSDARQEKGRGKEVHESDEQQLQDPPKPTRKKKAKKSSGKSVDG